MSIGIHIEPDDWTAGRRIELPNQFRTAEMRAATFDDKERTVDLVFSTGARVRRYTWTDGAIDEELDMSPASVNLDRLNAGAPFLDTHDSYTLSSVIGAVVRNTARISQGLGLATVKLSAAPEHSSIVQNIRDGIIRNVSVGYQVNKVMKTEGNDGDVPVWRVTNWTPMEISAVPIPADAGAQMRSDKQVATHPCLLIDQTNSAGAAMARMRMREREIGLRV